MGILGAINKAFHQPDTRAYRWVSSIVWVMIVISGVFFAAELWLEDDPDPESKRVADVLYALDQVLLMFFALEVSLRIVSYQPQSLKVYQVPPQKLIWEHIRARAMHALSPLVLVDLLTVLALVPALRALRALRLLRLLRSNTLFRYRNPFSSVTRAFNDNALLFTFALSFLGSAIGLGGVSLFLAERGNNPNLKTIGDGMWWAIVTISTVGYGDVTPWTPVGRGIAAVLMVVGLFTMALFAGIVGSTLLTAVLTIREEQFRVTRHYNHVVLCGYEAGAEQLLRSLDQELHAEHEAVIFSPGARTPDIPPRYRWVQGDPTKESELDKAHVSSARAVIIVGRRSVAPQLSDAITILTAFTLRAYLAESERSHQRKKPLYIVAEILDQENVRHAKAAGADEVIESNMLGFSLLAHAITQPGTGHVLSTVASTDSHSMYVCGLPEDVQNKSFGAVRQALRGRYGVLILGFRDPETQMETINPSDEALVLPHHQLIYIAEKPLEIAPRDPAVDAES